MLGGRFAPPGRTGPTPTYLLTDSAHTYILTRVGGNTVLAGFGLLVQLGPGTVAVVAKRAKKYRRGWSTTRVRFAV